jgi:1-acyl-sn-glycerol-3-phosphate acyltransferase
MILLRSLLFNIAFFGTTAGFSVLSLPILLMPRSVTRTMMHLYAGAVRAEMRWILGLHVRVEGAEHIPPGACLIASKHQSAYDTIFWLGQLPDTCYVMKRELLRIPLWGWYARHAGMIAVDRDGGGAALKGMVRTALLRAADGRHIVIYPEGTRTAPGTKLTYQPGVAALASSLRVPVVPVATNSGLFWGRRNFIKRPGTITVRVLPPLTPGLPRAALMAALEEAVERESNALLAAE